MRISDWSSDVCSSDLTPACHIKEQIVRCLKIQTDRPAGRVALVLYDADTIDQIAGADFLAGIKRHISRAAQSPAAAQHFVPAITPTTIPRQALSALVSDLPKQSCVRFYSTRWGEL